MIAQRRSPVLIPRRCFLLFPLCLLVQSRAYRATLASSVERDLIATVERDAGLDPPLTLGIARVVLRPGSSAFAATPNGARMIVVESGVLAVASVSQDARPFTSVELAVTAPAPDEGEGLFVQAGTAVTFGSLEVARVRNPGARSVVALDVAVFREEPRPIARFYDRGRDQLPAPGQCQRRGRSSRSRRVGAGAVASRGLVAASRRSLPRIDPGLCRGRVHRAQIGGWRRLRRPRGRLDAVLHAWLVATHRHRRRAWYHRWRCLFLPVGAECGVANAAERPADVLALSVREVALRLGGAGRPFRR